jgi:hypothetical protein
MKTVVTTLAAIAILATSAIAKTERKKIAPLHPNNSVTRISATQFNDFYCHLHYGQTDPDPRVRLQLVRDCHYWDDD